MLFLATIVGIGIFLFPKVLSLHHQVNGGQLLQSSLRSIDDVPDIGITCAAIPKGKRSAIARVELATEELIKALQYDTRNAQAQLYLGQSYCLLGDPLKAKEYFWAYTKLRPRNPLGHMGYGFAIEATDGPGVAIESWRSAGFTAEDFIEAGNNSYQSKYYDSALNWYLRSVYIEPNQAQGWIKIGQTYDALAEPEHALEAYKKAWIIEPENSMLSYVNSLVKNGQIEIAIDVLRQDLMSQTQSTKRLDWWKELGSLLRAQQNWDEAIQTYQEALDEFPDDIGLHIELGWSYYRRGDNMTSAQGEFMKAIRIDDQVGDGYFAMAQLLSQENQYEKADVFYLQALDTTQSNKWYFIARGDNARNAGQLSKSIEIYQDTINRFPDFAHAYYQLALSFRGTRQYQEAIEAIEQALELMNPPQDSYYARAGEIYRLAGLRDQALEAYKEAIKLNPNNTTSVKGLELLGD
jgi:tetratricopeptide (TPR) repeat protein